MKKLLLLFIAILSSINLVNAQTSTLYFSILDDGNYHSEKWVDITTGPNSTGTVIWAQGNGTYGDSPGIVTNIDFTVTDGETYYINAYDKYADTWDGDKYEIRDNLGNIVINNNGLTPDDGTDDDATDAFGDTQEQELEVSESFSYTPPTCSNPLVTASDITFDSAIMTWESAPGATNYDWELLPSGNAQGMGVLSSGNTTDLNITLSTLVSATNYDFIIKSDCMPTTWSDPVPFSTPVPLATNVDCASILDLANLTSPYTSSTENVSNDFIVNCLDDTTSNDLVFSLVVPDGFEVKIGQTDNDYDTQHRFSYGPTCPGDSLLSCLDFDEFKVESWTNLSGTDQTIYWIQSGYADNFGTFTLEWSLNACPSVSGLEVNEFSLSGDASINWNALGSATSYSWEIQPVDSIQGSPNPIDIGLETNNFGSITGLEDNVEYTLYVQTNCNAETAEYSSLNFTFQTPIINDACDGALSLMIFEDEASSLGNETTVVSGLVNEGVEAPYCHTNGGEGDDTWYSFVADTNALVISTIEGTNDDWAIVIYDACDGNIIACNDDANANGSTYMPEISLCQFEITPGQTYYIRVFTYSTIVTGDCQIYIYNNTVCPTPPANDLCLNAESISNCPDVTIGSTINSTAQTIDNPTCDLFGAINDVWYTFNTTSMSAVNITIQETDTLGLIESMIYTNTCDSLVVVANSCGSGIDGLKTITLSSLEPNTDVFIRVWNNDTGNTFEICMEEIITNDNCDEALVMTIFADEAAALGNETTVVSGLIDEGLESPYCHGNDGQGDDTWYSFVADTNAIVISTIEGTDNDWAIAVYDDCGGNIIACNDDANANGSEYMPEISICQFDMTPGQTYFIRIFTYGANAIGDCQLYIHNDISCPTPPDNNICTSAENIATCPEVTSGTTINATPQTIDNPSCDQFGIIHDVWYAFNSGTMDAINVTIQETDTTDLIGSALYYNTCDSLIELTGACGPGTDGLKVISLTSIPENTDFFVRIWSNNSGNTFDICLEGVSIENDDCDGAVALTIFDDEASAVGNETTVESGVVDEGLESPYCHENEGQGDDTWYSFIADTNAITISTIEGTNDDWTLAVYDECGGNIIACNDDANANGSEYMPEISLCQFDLSPGQTYYIRIFTWDDVDIGDCQLYIYNDTACPTPPSNDICDNSESINTCPEVTSGTTVNATPQTIDNPSCDQFGIINDVWYTLNSGNMDSIEIVVSNTDSTIYYELYTGTCDDLSIVPNTCDNGPNTIALGDLNVDGDYFLRVWSELESGGTFDICFTDLTIGIEDPVIESTLSISPNPSNDFFNLSFESLEKEIIIEVRNMLGQTILSEVIKTIAGVNQHEIDLSNVQSGIYNLILTSGEKSISRKIVKN